MTVYRAEHGQLSVLTQLRNNDIPPVTGFSYPTHAMYAALDDEPTLMFGYDGTWPYRKYEATGIANHTPGEMFMVTSYLTEKSATGVMVSESLRHRFPAEQRIAAVQAIGTPELSTLVFLGNDMHPVEIPDLPDSSVRIAVTSFLTASAVKLDRIKNRIPRPLAATPNV